MILFKACPRCGGDVDVTCYADSFCFQCAYRPTVVYPGPRVVERPPDGDVIAMGAGGHRTIGEPTSLATSSGDNERPMCPKCGSEQPIRLDKLRSQDHTCYRCRFCGHIFSPRSVRNREQSKEASKSHETGRTERGL